MYANSAYTNAVRPNISNISSTQVCRPLRILGMALALSGPTMPPEEDATQSAMLLEEDITCAVSISKPRAPSTNRTPAKRNKRRVLRGRSARNLRYASRTITTKMVPGTTQKKEIAPLGVKPVMLCNKRSDCCPIASCIEATSSRDKSKRMMESTPQCKLYRSLRRLLATVTTARSIEQSRNRTDSNHVGMLLSWPTSNILRGCRYPSTPHMYIATLATKDTRVMTSTAMLIARTIFFTEIARTMMSPSLRSLIPSVYSSTLGG